MILPAEDIDPEAAERLIWLASVDQPPFDPKPGEPWKKGNAAEDLARPDERVMAAARLADFLKARQAAEPIPALRVEKIHPMTEHRRLSVEFDDQLIVFWGEPPGGERPGEPTASEKWDMLRDHVRRHGTLGVPDPTKTYLRFTKDGLVERPRPRNEPRARLRAGPDPPAGKITLRIVPLLRVVCAARARRGARAGVRLDVNRDRPRAPRIDLPMGENWVMANRLGPKWLNQVQQLAVPTHAGRLSRYALLAERVNALEPTLEPRDRRRN